jgi:hypothetical protein
MILWNVKPKVGFHSWRRNGTYLRFVVTVGCSKLHCGQLSEIKRATFFELKDEEISTIEEAVASLSQDGPSTFVTL